MECGEIVVNGDSVTAGWINAAGQVSHFPADELHTGDIGFFENGELFIVERAKSMVIRNGQNYSTHVLESTLADIVGSSLDHVMVLDTDIATSSGLTGIIEVKNDTDSESLFTAVIDNIDRFELSLEAVLLVKRGVLPRTTSGKKRYLETRKLLNLGQLSVLAQKQITAGDSPVRSITPPDSAEDERRLLALIARNVRERQLDVPVALASRLQHDLEFDSLGLLELAVHIEEDFNIELDREVLAEVQTVSGLLATIRACKVTSPHTGNGVRNAIQEIKDQMPHSCVVVDEVRRNREVRVEGKWMVDFACCNYLSLERRNEVISAVAKTHDNWGLQRWPTRAVAVARPVIDLESRLARLIGVPDTLVFPTFTLLHMGVLPALAGEQGAIIIDSAAHKSMQEASLLARAKGTTVKTYAHGNLQELERALQSTQDRTRRIIAVDGIYSMSGEMIDLPSYQDLAKRYDAIVYVDDAHGFGVCGESPSPQAPYGKSGNGIVRYFGCGYDRIIYVGGLTKAFSTTMAFVSCPTPEYRALFEASSTAIFGHAVPMAVVAQAHACLDINEAEGDRIRKRLHRLTKRLIDGVTALGYRVESKGVPVVKVRIGDLESTIRAARVLWDNGILLTPAIFPAAPIADGGLRFTVNATHTNKQIDMVIASLKRLKTSSSHDGVIAAPTPVSGLATVAQAPTDPYITSA